ncbi:GntR family transcriptional regulator [Conexibacter sp. CPCC 206217]|uniref:GntR family transcriptional regulator n=1 Tax=Conexibacter sp. CPCC 206217 TaxID=3064574 RepID=UPI0027262AC2|nr:GntR family transcriptional regulator [Conexibacter sp. CPCC 206217]MDO8213885.1 GntR family transcriptional regulator [Conexibacter sp. CPCC 206217]
MSPFPPISLDRDAEVPLGTQLAWALRARVAGGQLAPGERLPGARELAAQIGVNVNTVRAVYARLEDEGLLLIAHGRGTFVAEAGGLTPGVAEMAAAVTDEARRRGIDPRAVAAALYVHDTDANDTRAREALRSEISELERRLAALPPAPLAAATPDPSGAGRLLSAQELRQERDALIEELRERSARLEEPEAPRAAERTSVTRAHGAKLRWLPSS